MTSADLDPLLLRTIYGKRVRAYRQAAGLDLDAAAQGTGINYDKLSKIENGVLSADQSDTEAQIATYGIAPAEASDLRTLGESARQKAGPTGSAGRARRFLVIEQAADETRLVYPYVPGLFQTAEYALVQLRRAPTVAGADAESFALQRQARGDRLVHRTGSQVWAIIGEEATIRINGSPDVMKRQLERLLMFSQLNHVSIRIHPLTAGDSPGLSNPFTLLWVAAADFKAAYTENISGTAWNKKTGAFTASFEDAQEWALSETDTQTLLERRIEDL
ncbi:transcriptional regulator with XRE-family HTH domain [Actinokineospora baliensis]|uniref:DUF5753 domain-containing protein n=1 Tax=Actinokineospora baliensis TaxID=547056 RepID=UPI001959D4A0|nr:DUF5753 domain-containing protein [Actinokineospora baliensis]MBM7770873.1 transcriptional regulator with XRE-family HTH domain [Actinokineospora baliensis]